MTEDMPTVNGARAEAERRYTYPADLLPEPTTDWREADAFVAGVEWLSPTVAALEAEVERLRIDRTADEQANARLREIVDEQRVRADAAEAVIDRVRGIVTDWGAGTVHRPRSPYYDRLRAALSDAAPQAVAAPLRVDVAGRRSGKTSAMAQAIVNDARERGVPVEVVDGPEVVETRCGCRTNEAGDVRCHKCGQYVNIRCWTCRTPRGEGPCPNPVPATDGREGA